MLMGDTYKITAEQTSNGVLLRLAFGSPAQNDQIVKDAALALDELKLAGGQTVLLNGPASLPVACVLGHKLAHTYAEVAVFDPKMSAYVVAISHGGRELGTLIKA